MHASCCQQSLPLRDPIKIDAELQECIRYTHTRSFLLNFFCRSVETRVRFLNPFCVVERTRNFLADLFEQMNSSVPLTMGVLLSHSSRAYDDLWSSREGRRRIQAVLLNSLLLFFLENGFNLQILPYLMIKTGDFMPFMGFLSLWSISHRLTSCSSVNWNRPNPHSGHTTRYICMRPLNSSDGVRV